ncbi:MAG: copper resistance protein B [Sphingosinicella sp.]|nr:copper resistance protein B [Sphingosinicella sp.]
MIALGFQPAIAAAQTVVELEVDLLEVHVGRGDDHLVLDSTLTLGDGADQLLVKAAGGSDTRTAFDDFEVQALYSRSLSDKAALHLGVRHDVRAGSDLTHGVAGMVVDVLPGLEAEHYVFVSQDGDLAGAGQLLLGVDLTPRLVLEPRLAVGWSAQEIPDEDLGNGFTDVEASLRLRHSLGEHFNVYTGVVHERLLGSTRSIAVAAGDPWRVTRAVLGFGFSF